MKGIASRPGQRGIAVLFIVLMLGLASAVTILGILYALRGGQQQYLTTHTATAAQAAAWRGVEALRRTLEAMDKSRIAGWAAGGASPCSAGTSPLSHALQGGSALNLEAAELTSICSLGADTYRIHGRVTGRAGIGDALTTATVEVVYEVHTGSGSTPGGEGGTPPPDAMVAVVTFNDDLNLSGSITVRAPEGMKTQINVKGDLTTGGNSITGVDTLWTTGSVNITSGSSFNTLASNGDIRFNGSVSVTEEVRALGNICISGGASTAADARIRANGSVLAPPDENGGGGVTLGHIEAGGQSNATGTALCPTVANDQDGVPYAVDLQANNGAASVTARGSFRIATGPVTRDDGVRATGHFVTTGCASRISGRVGKSVTGTNPGCPQRWSDILPDAGVTVAISPVSPVVLDSVMFNAYALEDQAHYAFKIDANGYRVVTTRNVNGIADRTWFIGDYTGGGYKDYLCEALVPGTPQGGNKDDSSSPLCATPRAQSPGTLCKGYSEWNRCLFYDTATRTWQVTGTSMAPGLAWFEGNLSLINGIYYNSFIATGNIGSDSGAIAVYAPNYVGYDGSSTPRPNAWSPQPEGICDNDNFPNTYPLDYCDRTTGEYGNPDGSIVGNYAVLAGSYDADGEYVGGDIRLGAATTLYGSVMAGNLYGSGGSSTIHGTVTALSQGDDSHAAGGSTTIDLTNLPDTFDPAPPACQLTGTCDEATPEADSATRARVLWSRYR